MDIQEWINRRKDTSSMAGMARQLWQTGAKYEELQSELRQQYIVEALVANGGSQKKTARVLGIHHNTVYRAMRAVGLSIGDVREAAKERDGH